MPWPNSETHPCNRQYALVFSLNTQFSTIRLRHTVDYHNQVLFSHTRLEPFSLPACIYNTHTTSGDSMAGCRDSPDHLLGCCIQNGID
jgi:hypothetical protein